MDSSSFENGSRRAFIQSVLLGMGVGALRPTPAHASAPYIVATSRSNTAYNGTLRAISDSGQWPDVVGKTVVVKPNVVIGAPAESGITTDPEATRAVVDFALSQGAARVKIVEETTKGLAFMGAGYLFFKHYDPRVSLVELSDEPVHAVQIPTGPLPGAPPHSHSSIYLPSLLFDSDVVFVSVAKLKAHGETGASLSVKNLFGLPPIGPYLDQTREIWRPRFRLHDRGVGQSIADLLLARPIDFAVIDGIWGQQGEGPVSGTPIRCNIVFAGQNAVAVDRVALDYMRLSQLSAQHLSYATRHGLGPADMRDIQLVGDSYTSRRFIKPAGIPPMIWYPEPHPSVFAPSRGQTCYMSYMLSNAGETQAQIVRADDLAPDIAVVRTIRTWQSRPVGVEVLAWDGRDDAGNIVPIGSYGIRVQSRRGQDELVSNAMNWVDVSLP